MSKLNKNVITGFKVIHDRLPQLFFDEASCTPTVLRAIIDSDMSGSESFLQHFSPTGFRPFVDSLLGHRRIANKIDSEGLFTVGSTCDTGHQNQTEKQLHRNPRAVS